MVVPPSASGDTLVNRAVCPYSSRTPSYVLASSLHLLAVVSESIKRVYSAYRGCGVGPERVCVRNERCSDSCRECFVGVRYNAGKAIESLGALC